MAPRHAVLPVLLLLVVPLAGCVQPASTVDDGADAPAPAPADPAPATPADPAPEPAPAPPTASPVDPEASEPAPEPAGVRFILLGDMGTGEEGQRKVAAAMEAVCADRGCDFVLGLGDNVYESGVSDPHDPQFEEKFERPYANLTVPFHLVLGNHDNGEGVYDTGLGSDSTRGDHQVAYHYRTDRASDKWRMPSRYYSFREGDVQFFGLDTNTMVWMGDPQNQRDLLSEKQAAWFRQELAKSNATWKFTFAHHPYVSNGQHGNAGSYDGAPGMGNVFKDFFEQEACGRVDAHFAGHDHDLQWLEPVDACPLTEHLVSGAGAKTRSLGDPDRNAASFQTGDTLGFVWVQVVDGTFHGVVYDADRKVLHEQTFEKRTK